MDVLKRAWAANSEKNLSLVAGGVTYYLLLALFPALAALVSIYGLVADPHTIETEMNAMSGLLPGDAQHLISSELQSLVNASGGALSFGVVVGLLIALWSASRGMSGMISALDIAYGQEETRSFVRFNLTALVPDDRADHRRFDRDRADRGPAGTDERRRRGRHHQVGGLCGGMAAAIRLRDDNAGGACIATRRTGMSRNGNGYLPAR